MADGSGRRNPLSPYYPSETPRLTGTGRRWVAIVLLLSIGIGLPVTLVTALLDLL